MDEEYMKASEVIEELQKLIAAHGDLPVKYADFYDFLGVDQVYIHEEASGEKYFLIE